MNRFLRRSLAAALALASAAALAGCSQSPASAMDPASCEPAGVPGAASEAVQLSGVFGRSISASVDGLVAADRLELSRLGAGAGPVATDVGVIEGRFTIVALDDGATIIEDLPFAAADDGTARPLTVSSIGAQLPGAGAALRCAQAGDRIVAAMPAVDLFGAEQTRAAGIDPGRTVAFAADITRVFPSSAAGRILPPVDGIPAVVAAPDGRPGATMPQSPPPTELRSALRVQGYGDPIAVGDELTLHVSIFDWTSGAELVSTWGPGSNVMQVPAGQSDHLFGVTEQLIGEPEGSQLIAVVPTEVALSQPGPLAPSLITGRTLVLVVDVLAADPVG